MNAHDCQVMQDHWRQRASFAVLDVNGGVPSLLALAAALVRDPHAPASLHYVVLAAAWPDVTRVMQMAQIAQAATMDARFDDVIAQLCRAWPLVVSGFHRLRLLDGRLSLTLVGGDVARNVAQLEMAFDTCHVAVSDVLHSPVWMSYLGRLAAPDALLAMPEAPSAVRAAVRQAGFVACDDMAGASWFRFQPRGRRVRPAPAWVTRHAIVIGAGLAGAAACHRLSVRGWRCTLIEQEVEPAQHASGNVAGIFMPVLSKDDNPLSRLTRAAYLFALHIWDGLDGVPKQACGVLQLARSDKVSSVALNTPPRADSDYPPDFARWIDRAEASAALQRSVAGGWWFAAAGCVHPATVCRAMLDACGERLQTLYGRMVQRLHYADGNWQVCDAHGLLIASAPVLILANGVQATQFAVSAALPLSAIRGQVTHLPAQASSLALPFVVCGDAYVTPPMDGIVSVGATYDHDAQPTMRVSSHAENLQHLQQMLPDWQPPSDLTVLGGRVGFRCVAPDRLPMVGALPDPTQSAGSGDVRLAALPRLPGLYGLLGYGSRGLIWSPLAAELLAAQLDGEPWPLPRDLVEKLDPARFVLRERRRAKLGPRVK